MEAGTAYRQRVSRSNWCFFPQTCIGRCFVSNMYPRFIEHISIAATGRTYFYSSALIVYALMSSYSFASFPYDNACSKLFLATTRFVGIDYRTR
jgi:hypothetical protein